MITVFPIPLPLCKSAQFSIFSAPSGVTCDVDYHYFRGNCYRYYQWVLRHYKPENYTFQATWQKALDQCEAENATLLSVHDEDESYFIKVSPNGINKTCFLAK